MPARRTIGASERYTLLRRLEARLLRGDAPTTKELAQELGIDRRTVCKYIHILETAEEFRVALAQICWRWEIFE